ncbi:hypothetical protein ISS85_04840 [Candidatus Microgenomates bacterium]|nr:hypothetical protein [Candidatus Microgenomates bacterium]
MEKEAIQTNNTNPSQPPKQKTGFIIAVTVFSLLLAITAIFAYQNYQLKKQTAQVPPVLEPTTNPSPVTDQTANWKTYNSKDKYYSVSYPPNWNVYEYEEIYVDRSCIEIGDLQTEQLTQLHLLDAETLKKHTSIQICFFPDLDMPKLFPHTNGSEANDTIRNVIINNYSGIRGEQTSTIGFEQRVDVENPGGGYSSIILEIGDLNIFDQILSTFKFIK